MPDRTFLMLENMVTAVNNGFSYDKIVSVPEIGLEDAWQRPGLTGWIDSCKDIVQKPFTSLQAIISKIFNKKPAPDGGASGVTRKTEDENSNSPIPDSGISQGDKTTLQSVSDDAVPVNNQDSLGLQENEQESKILSPPSSGQPRKRVSVKEGLGKDRVGNEGIYEEHSLPPRSDIRGEPEESEEQEVFPPQKSENLSPPRSGQPRKRISVTEESLGKGKDKDGVYEEYPLSPGSGIREESEKMGNQEVSLPQESGNLSPPGSGQPRKRIFVEMKGREQHHEEDVAQSSPERKSGEVGAGYERQPRKSK